MARLTIAVCIVAVLAYAFFHQQSFQLAFHPERYHGRAPSIVDRSCSVASFTVV